MSLKGPDALAQQVAVEQFDHPRAGSTADVQGLADLAAQRLPPAS